MQAQMQATRPRSAASRRDIILLWILGIHLVSHAMWLSLPSIVEMDDVGLTQYIVNSTTLTVGLVALFGMWKGFRWGRWTMIVLGILMALLTIPEMFFLTGLPRVAAILAAVGIATTLILLFRPEDRARS